MAFRQSAVKIPKLVYRPVNEPDESRVNEVFNYLFDKLIA